MVTIGIFVFMTALVMARYNSFYSGTLFSNLAYDIALTIKEAQTYGISVKVTDPSLSSTFKAAYGVHFDKTANTTFTLFADTDSSPASHANVYNIGTDAVESQYYLRNGGTISGLCVGTNGSSCDSTVVNLLDIVFRRPQPAALISVNGSYSATYNYAEITIRSGDGSATKKIKVTGVGLISVSD